LISSTGTFELYTTVFDTLPRRGSGGSDSHVTENVVSQILTAIDGLEELNNVLIIGATNR